MNECGDKCFCSGEGQYCDQGRCLPCKTDKDCSFLGQNCNTATGQCVDKSFSPESDCYNEGENPFEQQCAKSHCCTGTELRLHPKDPKNSQPYYICSKDESYPLASDKPPQCAKGTPTSCFGTLFCPHTPPSGVY
jgi:hypothetical protein